MSSDSGKSHITLLLALFLIGGVAFVASNFIGPYQGWLGKSQKPIEKPVTKTEQTISTKIEVKKETQVEAVVVNKIESLHASFVKKYLDKHPLPNIGKRYKVYPKAGSAETGTITALDKDYVSFESYGQYNGKLSFHFSKLKSQSIKRFFPARYAQGYADRKLEKELAKMARKKKEALAAMNTAKDKIISSTTKLGNAKRYPKLGDYIITQDKSPSFLLPVMTEFANYLKVQSRGQKNYFQQIHTKRHSSSNVLYLEATKDFAQESQEFRYQYADGLRRYFAMRSINNGLGTFSKTFICIHYNDKIIVKSDTDNAEELWSKKKVKVSK